MPERIDLTGQRFGDLTVLRYAGNKGWECRCVCGTTTTKRGSRLRSGQTLVCSRSTHAKRYSKRFPVEYRTWSSAKGRCMNPNDPAWRYYGSRGIKMCRRWRDSFENFLEDMGPRPSADLSLDRIDNDGDYEPGNCRWTDRSTQARNSRTSYRRMLTFRGKTMALSEWAREIEIPMGTLSYRLRAGWSVERALTEPLQRRPWH